MTKQLKSKNDPLPITSKFCCYFELQPSVTIYVFGELLVWTLFLFTSLNLEFECLDTTDLSEFHAVLSKSWYYNLIFGQPDPIPHDNARSSVIFLNTVLVAVFFMYFLFTPFLLIGLFRASPNWFIPYLIYDIIMINLSGCFFIVAAIVLNWRTFWVCFTFFALKLNSAIGVFSLYKEFGGVIDDSTDRVSWTSGLSTVTTMESLCDPVDV